MWMIHSSNFWTAFFVLLSVLIRLVLLKHLPLILTQDSFDYLRAANDNLQSKIIFSPHLTDWRLPIYPLFLAITWIFTGFNSQMIVLIQSLLGVLSMLVGYSIGKILRSNILAALLVLFLGINPVYLLNEHLLMSETLFLFLLLTAYAFFLLIWQGSFRWVEGGLFGFFLGLSFLTRANGSAFILVLILGLMLHTTKKTNLQEGKIFYSNSKWGWLTFLGVFLLLIGAWTWRNAKHINMITPTTANIYRNRLIYLAQHQNLNPDLPQFKDSSLPYDPLFPNSIYSAIEHLSDETALAEQHAKILFREQIVNQPKHFFRSVIDSVLHFSGLNFSKEYLIGRDDMLGLFDTGVDNIAYLDLINRAYDFDPATVNFTYVSVSQDTIFTKTLSLAGKLYLRIFRPIFFILFFSLFITRFVIQNRYHQMKLAKPILLLFVGYCSTWIVHSLILADYDRFATIFDWIPVLICTYLLPMKNLIPLKLKQVPANRD